MAEEIALFIDFENIRYSLLNTQHREPDPQELINIARRYGTVMVAKAYADWSRQPDMFKGSLTAAMIDRVDCPAKQRDRYRSGPWQSATANGNGNGWNPNGSQTTTEMATVGNWNASNSNIPIVAPDDTAEPTDDPSSSIGGLSLDTASPSSSLSSGSLTQQNQSSSQSTVDLNMLMDIIETVFDRPTISVFVLMTGDRDFTRICARLKLRLNKHVVVAGVPGTVSRDLTAAANQFVLLGTHTNYTPFVPPSQPTSPYGVPTGIEPTDPQLIQFLDYIDRHWAWRTVIGVANFIGDPYNHKNRFRGRLNRESARELLYTCVQQGILTLSTDTTGNEDLRLNRENPTVIAIMAANQAHQQQMAAGNQSHFQSIATPASSTSIHGPYSQMGPWTGQNYATINGSFNRRPGTAVEEEPDTTPDLNDVTPDVAEVTEE